MTYIDIHFTLHSFSNIYDSLLHHHSLAGQCQLSCNKVFNILVLTKNLPQSHKAGCYFQSSSCNFSYFIIFNSHKAKWSEGIQVFVYTLKFYIFWNLEPRKIFMRQVSPLNTHLDVEEFKNLDLWFSNLRQNYFPWLCCICTFVHNIIPLPLEL